jgi:hypothetical protein
MATASAGTALAADTYVQPQAELRAETNSNFNFVPGGSSKSNVYGYIAELQALIGIATPRSDTSIRPRVKVQEYPDRKDFDRFEAFFDLRSEYRWERSKLLTIARYSQEDTYNTETPGGGYDPNYPDDPGNADSGTIVVGETRTRYQIQPEFTFDLTERTQAGVAADYESARYDSGSVQTHVDYDYFEGSGFIRWALDPRSDFIVEAYGDRYETTDNSSETDAYGGRLGYEFRWSEVAGVAIEVNYEQDDITEFVPVTTKESTEGWGGTVSAYRKGEVSAWRFSAGRLFDATGARSKSEVDQLRLQYDRDLTQRLTFTGAGRYEKRNSLSTGGGQGDDRDYARADLALRWMMAPTWYLAGGYSYIWQDRQNAAGSADNNKLFVGFGYKALNRQRR